MHTPRPRSLLARLRGFAVLAALVAPLVLAPGALAGTGVISGRVTSAITHDPLEGVEVCYERTTSAYVLGCAPTNANGEYVLSQLEPGAYAVWFDTFGSSYLSQYYGGALVRSEATWISVGAGATVPGIDAALQIGGEITGVVSGAVTGGPLAGVTVCEWGDSGRTVTNCDRTSSEGRYSLPRLASGEYTVLFTAEGYVTQYYNGTPLGEATEVVVSVGHVTAGVDATMRPPAAPRLGASAPAVSGAGTVGATLACSSGAWEGDPAPTFKYRWLRDGAAIAGAVTSAYTVQEGDRGHEVACEVTASNEVGSRGELSGNGVTVAPVRAPFVSPPAAQMGAGDGAPSAAAGSGGAGALAPPTVAAAAVELGSIAVRAGAPVIALRCVSGSACAPVTARLVVSAGGEPSGEVIASATVTLRANRRLQLVLAPNATGRRLLARLGRVRCALVVESGGHVLTRRTLVLKRPARGATRRR